MNPLVQVAVKSPVYGVFDYRWKSDQAAVAGTRVTVPFGRRQVIGIVVASIEHSDVPVAKLRSVHKVHDQKAVLPEDLLTLLTWASRYYHHPLGEVLGSALPGLLRKGHAATLAEREYFRSLPPDELNAPVRVTVVQQRLLDHLREHDGRPVAPDSLRAVSPRWRTSLELLIERQLVACDTAIQVPRNDAAETGPTLVRRTGHCSAVGQ